MLQFHRPTEAIASPKRLVELLQLARKNLLEFGMADMEEYGDMLKWGLPKRGDVCRNLHVYHPDWCSFDDKYWGTIHYHPGEIRGTVLLGEMEHYTYRAEESDAGDRFLAGTAYKLHRYTNLQAAGTQYALPPMVPHWLKPTQLTLTYFEEDDTGEMGDLINPENKEIDDHKWSQDDADSLLPVLLEAIEAKIAELQVTA